MLLAYHQDKAKVSTANDPLAPTALTGALAVGEQDCLDVHRTIQDVQDGDAVSPDPVENQVSTMHPATDAVMFVPGHHRLGLQHIGNVEAELV